ncbi:MAG: hypothetical protein AB8B87_11900 [Granulosicoccus sp.]
MSFNSSIFYSDQHKHLNIWWQGTLFLSVYFAINLHLYGFDQRLLADEALWVKPIKFEISVVIHFITLAVLASLLSPARRNGALWKAMSYVVVAAGIFEVMYIFLQASRGRKSHFNTSTAVESIMYSLMGLGALILVLGSFYLGYLLFREYQSKRNQPLLIAAALGLTIGSVLTLVIAGYMSSQTDNGITASTLESLRVPLVGWYLNGQDLRIPHFFATHMMQLLPLYGYWLSKKDRAANVMVEARLIWVASISCVLIMLLFILAVFVR